MDLLPEIAKVSVGSDLVADTTSETDSAVVDMQGFDEVTFLVDMGDVDAAAVLTFAVKENTASSTSSPTPTAVTLTKISSSAGVITGGNAVLTESSGNLDDKLILITVAKNALSKRYVFLAITATVESYEIDSITVIQRKSRDVPVTQSSDVVCVAKAQ